MKDAAFDARKFETADGRARASMHRSVHGENPTSHSCERGEARCRSRWRDDVRLFRWKEFLLSSSIEKKLFRRKTLGCASRSTILQEFMEKQAHRSLCNTTQWYAPSQRW